MLDNDQTNNEQTEDSTPLKEISSLETIFDRKKLLEITAFLIEDTYCRVSGERFRPREGDRERLAYLRTLKELLALHTAILHDANAPAWEGLPIAEDLEIVAARKKQSDDFDRLMYDLPLKRKVKVR